MSDDMLDTEGFAVQAKDLMNGQWFTVHRKDGSGMVQGHETREAAMADARDNVAWRHSPDGTETRTVWVETRDAEEFELWPVFVLMPGEGWEGALPGWYFGEAEGDSEGPFDTRDEAVAAFRSSGPPEPGK